MSRLSALFLAVTLGCGGTPSQPNVPANPQSQGGDPAAGDPGSPPGIDAACPDDFAACGGELVGVWDIQTFCPADGGSLTMPCEHPWDDQPECSGPPNSAVCTLAYGGSITFGADNGATVVTTAGMEATWVFSAECTLVAAADRNYQPTDPAEACASLSNDRLSCDFAADRCTCHAGPPSDPESETIEDVYVIDGNTVVIGPDMGEPIGGPYCVAGDELVIQNPIGWAYWVLERR